MPDHTELRRLAEGASPGEWEAVFTDDPRGLPVPYYRGLVCTVEHSEKYTAVVAKNGYVDPSQWKPNAQFIAAFNPTTAISLLDEIARLRGALAEVVACGEDGDGLWDTDAGAPGESLPCTSERLNAALDDARGALEPK